MLNLDFGRNILAEGRHLGVVDMSLEESTMGVGVNREDKRTKSGAWCIPTLRGQGQD